MPHDSTKVQLGTIGSSAKTVDNKNGTIEAGLAVRLKSDDTISLALSDGNLLGISVGKDLANVGRTAICREGLDVPLQLTAAFTPTIGTQVHISDTTGKAGTAGAGFTGTNATYKTGVLTGVKEDGTTEVNVALIDYPGGL